MLDKTEILLKVAFNGGLSPLFPSGGVTVTTVVTLKG
jgi:hypothetical protein